MYQSRVLHVPCERCTPTTPVGSVKVNRNTVSNETLVREFLRSKLIKWETTVRARKRLESTRRRRIHNSTKYVAIRSSTRSANKTTWRQDYHVVWSRFPTVVSQRSVALKTSFGHCPRGARPVLLQTATQYEIPQHVHHTPRLPNWAQTQCPIPFSYGEGR